MASDWASWLPAYEINPRVRFTLPPTYFFKIPPADIPRTLPIPSDHPTLAHPFAIPANIYNAALSPNVPVLAALTYATVITGLNSLNKSRKYKPWDFSRTRFFKAPVITHNIILALYSAWTCIGMVNALKTSIYPPWEAQGLAGTVDSLCKMHGPRNPGSAAVFGEHTSAWSIANRFVHLGADGLTPEVTDVGRIWNQGLAFYGWLFYLSKFYEVIDTLIIIAKGKKSSFLQTFHHAGAMLCMWAGMRYMSPPIWMFVLVNSFIHSIMYTFYLCSAVGVRVPVWFKRTLTTLQITQFIVGASYAFIHLFVKYQSPVSTPYVYHLGDVASAAVSTAVASASAVASDDWQALLKKLALRAAGREGLAENVYDHRGQPFGIDAVKAAKDWIKREEVRYRDDYEWVNCLDTSGQAFAILLNVVYLLPLTWLFANFFIQAYLRRVERRRSSTTSQKAQLARESVNDAAKKSGRRLSQAFEDPQDGVEDTGDEFAVVDGEEVKRKLKNASSKVKREASSAIESSREAIQEGTSSVRSKSSKFASRTQSSTEETFSSIKTTSSEIVSKMEEAAESMVGDVKQSMATTLDYVKAQADSLKTKAQELYQDDVEEVVKETKEAASSVSYSKDDNAEASEMEEAQSNENDATGDDAQGNNRETSRHDVESSTENIEKPAETKKDDDGTEEEVEELSPKEQVQQQESKPETETEASTGDAEEDGPSAEQSSTQDVSSEATTSNKKSDQEDHDEQDTSDENRQREDFSSQEVGTEKSGAQVALSNAVESAKDTASNAVSKAEELVEDPPPAVTETIQKVQHNVQEASNTISESIQSMTSTDNSQDKSPTQDYDDQKESWIHIPETSESKSDQKTEQQSEESKQSQSDNTTASETTQKSDVTTETTGTERPPSPEWFEKLTSGIDSPSMKKAQARVIGEEQGRDEASTGSTNQTSDVREASAAEESSTSLEKKDQDKIIDESELVRTEPTDQSTTNEPETSEASDEPPSGPSKEEQDKIIDESEPVRDEIKDTTSEETKESEDTTKDETEADSSTIPPKSLSTSSSCSEGFDEEVVARPSLSSPSTLASEQANISPNSSPKRWHAKRRGIGVLT